MPDSFPPWDCPNCRKPAGNPFLTTTIKERPNIVLVRVRCTECRCEWQVEHLPDGNPRRDDPNV